MRAFFLAIPLTMTVLGVGASCSSADPAGSTSDAGPVVDAPLDVCNGPVDGAAAYCDPSTPCAQSYLDCFYVPGCDKPHGTCERWAHCGDTAMTQFFCSCDGKTVTHANHPIASTAECAGGVDASGDSSDAPTDGG